jgi:hypothetical protein
MNIENTSVAASAYRTGEFHAQIDKNEKEICSNLRKWSKRAGRGSATAKISDNIIDVIVRRKLYAQHLLLISTRNNEGKIKAACLLEVPPNKPYTILQDLVNANKPNAKGAGKAALEAAKTVNRSISRDQLLLYALDRGVSDLYQNKLGFTFVKDVPDFPNGIYSVSTQEPRAGVPGWQWSSLQQNYAMRDPQTDQWTWHVPEPQQLTVAEEPQAGGDGQQQDVSQMQQPALDPNNLGWQWHAREQTYVHYVPQTGTWWAQGNPERIVQP